MRPPPTPNPALGVFETLLVVAGKPVEADRHLERLSQSVGTLYDAELATGGHDEALGLIATEAEGLELGRLRLDARPDANGIALSARAVAIDPAIAFPPRERGAELNAMPIAGWRGDHKWADRAPLDALDAAAAPATALLVDEHDGAVLETTRANLFAVGADGILSTPPADGRILPGVTRELTIELAHAADIDVVETVLTRADLDAAAELFVSGSVRGIEPVRALDGASIGGPESRVAGVLGAALRERWLG